MMNCGETANSSAEGEVATNSQAKGPNSDETLESLMTPKKQSFNLALIIINYYKLALKENLSGTITEANCLRNSSLFLRPSKKSGYMPQYGTFLQ